MVHWFLSRYYLAATAGRTAQAWLMPKETGFRWENAVFLRKIFRRYEFPNFMTLHYILLRVFGSLVIDAVVCDYKIKSNGLMIFGSV